jgi:hypothetical protein
MTALQKDIPIALLFAAAAAEFIADMNASSKASIPLRSLSQQQLNYCRCECR